MKPLRRIPMLLAAGFAAAATLMAAGPAQAAGTYSLLVLPDQGETQIYNFVDSATSSIDVTMYEFKDTTLANDLIARHNAGVNVRVILDQAQMSYDQATYNALTGAGISVVWSSTSFTYTHQKTITVDDKESYITTGNTDTTYYSTSRDYGVFDTDANDVAAVVAVFNADFAHTSITPGDGDDLVWSPTDSLSHLAALINGAQHSLDIEEEEFSDTTLVGDIVSAAQRGVTVRLVLENESNDYGSEISQVEAAGATVKTYTSSTGYYIHAKAIVADYGTSTAKAFQGSENFSSNSLGNNRELGLIVSDAGVVSGLESAFTADFNGTAGSGVVSVTNPGSQTSTVGKAASLQISASDTASGTLSYKATGLPAGLSISSSTGLISGTPTTAATSNVTVTATDSSGPSGATSFSWTVNPASTGNTVTVANPGNQTGTVGTAASLQISATDSASGQTLSYSAKALPAGLTINSATGLISGTPTTAGTYSPIVTATDTTGASGTASFSWTVNAAGGSGCTAAQLLGNPGFENGSSSPSPWTVTSTHSPNDVINDSSSEPPHSGTWDAWLDGWGTTTTDTVAQTITLPSGCSTYQFSFWLHINTAETSTSTAYDTLAVQVLNSSGTVLGTLATYSNLNANTGYAQHSFSLSAYAGQTVTLKFTGAEDYTKQTSFVLDDTAVNVS
ncbi:MAG TPA: putative Ig domain-containing protein [Actinocrinis sp.]|jgi:hypothetical protein